MDHSYCQSEGCFVHIYCSQCTHCQKVLCTEHIPVEAHRCQTPTLTVNNGNNTTTTSGGNANGNGVGGTIVGGNSNGSVSNIIAGGSSSSLTSDLLSVSASRLAYRRTRSREIGGVISGGSSGSSGSGVGSAVHNAAIGLVGTDRQVSISSPLTAPLVSLTGGGGEMDPIGGAPELLKRPSSSDLIRRGSSLLSRDVSGLGSLHPSGYINRGLSLFASDLPDYMRQSSPPSTIVGGVARLQSTDSPSLMGNSLVGSLVGGDPHLSHSSHHLLHPTSSSPHMIGIPLQKFTRSKSRELAQLGLGSNDYSFTSSTSGMASSSSSDPLHPSAVTQSLLPIPRHNRPSSLMTSGGNDIANGTMPASIGSPSHNPTSQMPLSISSHTPSHILSHHHHPTLAPSSLSTSHALAQVRNQFARSTSNDQHQHHSVTPTNETNVSETTPQPINHPSPQLQHQHQHQHHHQQQQTLQPPPASHTIHSPPQMKQLSSQPLPVATASPLAATGQKRKSSSRPTKQHSVDDSTLSTPAMQPGDNYYDSVLSASVGSKKRKLPQPSASVLPLNSTSTSNLLSTAHLTNQHLSSTVYPSHPSALSSSTLESESMRMEHIYSLLLSYTCATPSQRPSLPPNASAQDIAEYLVDGRGDELIAMWKSTSWDRPVGEFAAAIATLSITSHDRIGNESSTVGGLTGGSGFSYTPTITNRTLGSSSSALTPQPVHHPLLHTSTRIIEHLSRAFHMNALELSAFSLYLDRIEPDWINRASGEKTKGKEAANIVVRNKQTEREGNGKLIRRMNEIH